MAGVTPPSSGGHPHAPNEEISILVRHGDVAHNHVERNRTQHLQRSRADPAVVTTAPQCLRISEITSARRARHRPGAHAVRKDRPDSPLMCYPCQRCRQRRAPRNSCAESSVIVGVVVTTAPVRGRVTVNVEPLPSPALSAATVPPCNSTMCRTMVRPMPSPPCERVLLLSAWRKRSKTYGRNSRSIPAPLSRDAEPLPVASCTVDVDASAGRRELDGVGQQVPEDLLQPVGVAGDGRLARRRDRTASAIPLASAAGRTASIAAPIDGAELDRPRCSAAACRS